MILAASDFEGAQTLTDIYIIYIYIPFVCKAGRISFFAVKRSKFLFSSRPVAGIPSRDRGKLQEISSRGDVVAAQNKSRWKMVEEG